MGHLTRKYGLTIDNLLSVDMVLADGSFVVASAEENTDLFWAVRGGGGNFGIVTSFLFEAHPVGTVCAGPMLWNLEDAADVMKWYREFITQAPEEMNGFFAMMTVPPGPPFPEELHLRKMCAIVWCYQGSMEQANMILESIRRYRPPVFEFFVSMPFPMLQGMFDGIYPTGLQWYWKADFFKELSDRAIENIARKNLRADDEARAVPPRAPLRPGGRARLQACPRCVLEPYCSRCSCPPPPSPSRRPRRLSAATPACS